MDEVSKFAERYHDKEWITIALEGSDATFSVQKSLLCQASDYFKKALDGPMKEAQEGRLRLPGCHDETFKLFLYWLLKEKLPNFVDNAEAATSNVFYKKRKILHEDQVQLVRLWSFGDAYLMPKLQNAAVRALIKITYGCSTAIEALEESYRISTEGSIIRIVLEKEVLFDCREDRYHSESYLRLGAIPGLFEKLARGAGYCDNVDGCDCANHPPSRVEDISEYLLPE